MAPDGLYWGWLAFYSDADTHLYDSVPRRLLYYGTIMIAEPVNFNGAPWLCPNHAEHHMARRKRPRISQRGQNSEVLTAAPDTMKLDFIKKMYVYDCVHALCWLGLGIWLGSAYFGVSQKSLELWLRKETRHVTHAAGL